MSVTSETHPNLENSSSSTHTMSNNVNIIGESSDDLLDNLNNYVMYKRRWVGMGVICALNLSTGLLWLTFNAVPKISSNWLNTGWSETNLSVVLYFLGSIVASTFSGFVFEKWGIKRALVLGGLLNAFGSWLRYGAAFIESSPSSNEGRLILVYVGQFIGATAQPFFLNAPPKYAAVWFSESSRAIATTIGSLSNPLAAVVAMVAIPLICTEENGDDMPLTLLIVAIFALVALFPAFFISERPPFPPSPSAQISLQELTEEPFWVSIRQLSSNVQFWILFSGFSIYVGFFNTFSSLINQIVGPYGYTDDNGGIFAAFLILCGVPGAALAGAYVDKTKKYKNVLRACAPLLALCYIGFIFAIRENDFVGICGVCGVLGFSSFALLPVALELGIECTYPVPPTASSSTLWMGGQIMGVTFLLIGDALRDDDGDPPNNMKKALYASAALSVLTSAIMYLFNSPYYRLEAEKNKKETTTDHAEES